REFAEAVGDANPAYTDRDAAAALGHADVIAPPTFVFAITYLAAGDVVRDPQLGLDYSRVVHGDQKFAYRRPVRAGDRLTVTSTIEAIKSLAGNDILDVRVRDLRCHHASSAARATSFIHAVTTCSPASSCTSPRTSRSAPNCPRRASR
ncbi:MaoC family dehydratase N-terminal domain-containing protein, partial [Streptomyces sp. t39]|uniref:FAS1-like dehydratase domain-containing protein n=1 Tax=Streptomyces sp. t39 TaxID=1828156 RepID=UPI003967CF98